MLLRAGGDYFTGRLRGGEGEIKVEVCLTGRLLGAFCQAMSRPSLSAPAADNLIWLLVRVLLSIGIAGICALGDLHGRIAHIENPVAEE